MCRTCLWDSKGKSENYYEKVHIPLWHMAHIIAVCIVLYNMYIIGKDKFGVEWIEKIEE